MSLLPAAVLFLTPAASAVFPAGVRRVNVTVLLIYVFSKSCRELLLTAV